MDVDSIIAFSNRLYVKINNVVFIAIPVSFNRTVPLAERVILSLVLVNLPNRSVLPRYKNSSPFDTSGVLKPVVSRFRGTFPCSCNPALLIAEHDAHAVIKAIGFVVSASNTDDVQVVLT